MRYIIVLLYILKQYSSVQTNMAEAKKSGGGHGPPGPPLKPPLFQVFLKNAYKPCLARSQLCTSQLLLFLLEYIRCTCYVLASPQLFSQNLSLYFLLFYSKR